MITMIFSGKLVADESKVKKEQDCFSSLFVCMCVSS